MKIEMTAGQAQIALEAICNELWQIEKQSPVFRNQKRADATKSLIKEIATKMLQNGFISCEFYDTICN
ncbi:hypothetical protein [Duncaniella muris]|uniref:hypothetical protein n=2 Tax=Duncaniella TaxID=2518495 RepID=UPI0025B7913B|nr:hypothetical protein [Duncaniella muris]